MYICSLIKHKPLFRRKFEGKPLTIFVYFCVLLFLSQIILIISNNCDQGINL